MIKAWKEYNEKVWKPCCEWNKKYWWVYLVTSFIAFTVFWIWLKWERIKEKIKDLKHKLLNRKGGA